MNKKVKERLIKFSILMIFIVGGISIILYNISDNISYYITPSQLYEKKKYEYVKLGGFVKNGSIRKFHRKIILFEIMDENNSILVKFEGSVPQIFRDDQGVIVSGKYDERGFFLANKLLAKHDENYIPKKNIK